ncbi:MAG: hypothetical protein J6V50_02180 [Clostridia bacterium]|nr:hypothetical protein [Clostridia bacterium]
MKRILISILLVLCLVLSFSACGAKNPTPDASSDSLDSTSSTESKEPNILSVAQLELSPGTGGMSYVITLKDEGFIIIDGGTGGSTYYNKHSSTLFNYIFNRTPSGEKPVILGWFFTHFHSDHVQLASEFLIEQADRLDVRAFYINPAGDDDSSREFEMEDLVKRAVDAHPNADKNYIKTGQKIEFPHCTVDILLTSANLNTKGDTAPNNLSAVFKMNFDTDKSFLVTGDSDHDRILQLFNKNSDVYLPLEDLKCDIYQTPHHGRSLGDASDALRMKTRYEQLNPPIVFFPVAQKHYEEDEFYNDKKWAENYYLINNSGAQCFHQSLTVTVNMEDLSIDY